MSTVIGNVRRVGTELSLVAEGRLDGPHALEFQESLLQAIEVTDERVVIDFSQVSYISSAGLRAVLVVAKVLQRRKGTLCIFAAQSSVRDIFAISGFDRIVEIFD